MELPGEGVSGTGDPSSPLPSQPGVLWDQSSGEVTDGFLLPFLCALRVYLWGCGDNFHIPYQLDRLLSTFTD